VSSASSGDGPGPPLRVLVDATALPPDRGGVGRYVDAIVERLAHVDLDCHVAAQPRDVDAYAEVLGRPNVHPCPPWALQPAARLTWEQTGLPRLVNRLAPHVVHSPHYTFPLPSRLFGRSKHVVTVHDATFFSDAALHLGAKARFFRQWTRISGRYADAIIAPSRATKDEVVRHVGADPHRIAVIPHGVDHQRFRPPSQDDVEKLRHHLGLAPDTAYIAFLGTLEPRKNVPALVRAYVDVCSALPRPPVLVLAGGRGWDDQVAPTLSTVPAHLQVLRAGFVPDVHVAALLGGAEVVAYPAFGEGFGLPVLEAMACGAPVLTTRLLSLPEVGGDAVRYADSPRDVDLAAALRELLSDPDERARLASAAVRRAAEFTWDRAARDHVRVYEEVLAR
jgi:glycosyltransferase involved in cell wall biosynthesis